MRIGDNSIIGRRRCYDSFDARGLAFPREDEIEARFATDFMTEILERRKQEHLECTGVEAACLELFDEISVRIRKLRVDLAQHTPCRLKQIVADKRNKLGVKIFQWAYRRE